MTTTTPSPRWPNMRLLSSQLISPISGLQIPGKGQHYSSSYISRRNYLYWIAWWRKPAKSLRLHTSFFSKEAVESIPDLCHVCIIDIVCHQKTGSSDTLSYQTYYDLLKSDVYHLNIAINSAVRHCRAYNHLTYDDDNFGVGPTNFEPDHSDDNICTYKAYLASLSSPLPHHTSKVSSLSPF